MSIKTSQQHIIDNKNIRMTMFLKVFINAFSYFFIVEVMQY